MSAGEQGLREQFEGFSPRVLTWLGALPTWTAGLARRLQLPGGGESVADLVRRLDAEDLIETRQMRDADGRAVASFWLRPSLRPGLGRYLQQQPRAAARIDQDLDFLAAAVRALDVTSATAGSIGSAQWLRIVRDYRGDPTGLTLMTDVDQLVADGRLGDASTLVAAARGLGELASRMLFEAARRAQWRIDRAIRIEHDIQRLRHYCPRPAIETAIRELAESAESSGPDEPWALHLLGDGGVGKTMLIRYLSTGRFATAQRMRRPFLVARADFDHLDPSYPEQRPAELLLALAADLVGVTGTRERYRFLRLFQDAANALHEERAGRRPGADADTADDLRETVRQFAAFVGNLGAPILLVLDTCEELEKLYLPRAPAPAIDQTFRLLELVHEEAPTVRVLFAGRRWLVPPAERGGAGPLLRPRPYLRVVPVGGFTEAEAEAYIDDRDSGRREETASGAAESVPLRLASRPGLRQALLDRSRSATRPDGSAEYSPFELASYCDWAASDPGLDAKNLRSAPGDPLVEWRIIGRLGDDQVRAALGVAAEFGRFDLALISPALTRAGIAAKPAFDGLAAQEWVSVLSADDDGAPAVIEIDEHLLGRIRKVTARGPEWSPLDRRRLGDDARQVIDAVPRLARLPVETVEAAVRLLPPERAATLWQRIEDRCCQERAWAWAARVTERVAPLEARRAEESGAPSMLAAIFATQAAATVHTAPASDPTAAWRNAEKGASRHPDPAAGADLMRRARLGRLATGDLTDTGVLAEALHRIDVDHLYAQTRGGTRSALPFMLRETLYGSCIAALHGCVTRGQELPDTILGPQIDSLASLAGGSPAAVATALAFAVSRLRAGSPDTTPVDWAIVAAVMSEHADASEPERDWADWAPPRRLADQCRLVRMIFAWRHGEPLDAVPWREWRDEALGRLDDSDTERLAAATIRFELGHRPIGAAELERVESLQRYVPARQPPAWTHRQIGPLFAELAEAWRVHGDPRRGYALLAERIEFAVAAGDDPGMIEACQLAQLRLCRRERTTEYAPVRSLSREGPPHVRAQAWLVRSLVDGEQPGSPEEAGSWFAWWRCQDAASLDRLGTAVPVPPSRLSNAAEIADAAEYRAYYQPSYSEVFLRDRHLVFDAEAEFREAGRIELRKPPALPPGSFGREAMAAAEVTALRFPRDGISLLRDAALKLRAAGDQTSAVRATLLASLTLARQQELQEAETTWAAVAEPHDLSGGWQQRAAALEAHLSRRAAPAGLSASPEVRLPAVPGTSQPVARARRLPQGRALVIQLVTFACVLAALPLLLTRHVNLANTLGVVSFLGLFAGLVRVPSGVLPYRITRARAIQATRTGDGEVAVMADRSRGTRDLRGLGFATIGGGLLALWPLWTMFRPWRGRWTQSLSPDPPPGFDLDGLRLPKLGGLRRLAMLEIRIGDVADAMLPWEQWLGAFVSAERAAALLCYRRFRGPAWTPRRSEWQTAWTERYGSLPNQTPLIHPGMLLASFRLLHIVGTPVPTSAGWRLRVVSSSSASQSASRGAEAGEELLSLTAFSMREMGLAVLQAEPVDGPPQTLADQRAGFMGCAQEMMDRGANAVLIVPPLPDEVAGEVLDYLWKRVHGRRPLSPTGVLRIQADVKQLVAKASPPGSASHHPILDVLLFLRSERSD